MSYTCFHISKTKMHGTKELLEEAQKKPTQNVSYEPFC